MSTKRRDSTNETGADRERWSEAERQAEHRIRMRFEYRDLIEDLIQDGRERGLFDNLRGAGKPLNLETNVFEGERSLANALLKEHDLLPAWLEKRKALDAVIDQLRQEIGRLWQRHDQAYRLAGDNGRQMALAQGWNACCRAWEQKIKEINRQIENYNLHRPADGLEMFKLRLDDELKRAGARRELKKL